MSESTLPTTQRCQEFQAEWAAFRRAWLDHLSDPYGLLSPIGLHWLDVEPQEFEDFPGAWSADPDRGIVVTARRADGLQLDGVPLDGETEVYDGRAGRALTYRDIAIVPLLFGAQTGQPAQFAIQPRDPYVASRRMELGIPTYPADPKWVVDAHFEPYAERRPVTLRTIVDNRIKDLSVFGRVTFTLNGKDLALEVYAGPSYELHIPFRDATSGVTSFAGARLVFAPRPAGAQGGPFDFELDFNRAINGPCGLSPYTTCALPPPGNTLPVAIEAGEQIPIWMSQPSDWAR
jgi:uncharacterized protein (DUF1684 family)